MVFAKIRINAIAALFFLSTVLLGLFFLSMSFSIENLWNLNFAEIYKSIVNPVLWLSLFLLSMAVAATVSFADEINPKVLAIESFVFSIIAAIVVGFAVNEIWIFVVGVALSISFIFSSQLAAAKQQELKKFPTIRTGIWAANLCCNVVALFIFLYGIYHIMPLNQQYVANFEELMFGKPLLMEEQSYSYKLAVATGVANAQRASIQVIESLPGYSELKNKQDADVQKFIAAFEKYKETINSPEYVETIMKGIGKTKSYKEIISKAKKQFPLFGFIEKYLWLFLSLAASFLFFASRIVVAPLAGILAIVLKAMKREARLDAEAAI